jgi:SAM-dependent methyltransferase
LFRRLFPGMVTMERSIFENYWNGNTRCRAASRQLWDLRADEFNSTRHQREGVKRRAEVLRFLEARGLWRDGIAILDIGCGPGKYAIELAQKASSVVGVDLSPRMIRLARENAVQAGAGHIRFEEAVWDETDLQARGWNRKFDLVFASMCPGINSPETLAKMSEASKNYCFMSHFAWRRDSLRDDLYRALYHKEPEHSWEKNIYCAFNLLWLAGFYPEITYYDTNWENEWPLEEAVEIYSLQVHPADSAAKDMLRSYLERKAENGLVKETTQSKIAWMNWRV